MTATIPRAPAVNQERIPLDLKRRRQWVVWRWELRKGKWTKPLYNARTGKLAKVADGDNPPPATETWSNFDEAIAAYQLNGWDGIGYVFHEEDPYTGIDLDGCRDPETGTIEPWAADLLERFASYSELSPSGKGVHILIQATLPEGKGRHPEHIGVFDRGRYFTMTGETIPEAPPAIAERQGTLEALYRETFAGDHQSTPRPKPAVCLTLDDQQLLERARNAKNGAKFQDLMAGTWQGYGYPSQSEADEGLCSMLAFWTQDEGQIDRIFRQSGLYRDKWEREKYRQDTIAKGLNRSTFWDPSSGNGSVSASSQGIAICNQVLGETEPADCPAVLAVAQARIAELERLLTIREEKIQRLQARIRMHNDEKRVRQNPGVRTERNTIIELAHTVATLQARERRRARAEGREPSPETKLPPYKVLAERIGCNESTISRHVKTIENWGKLKKRTTADWKPERVNRATGEILSPGYVTETYVTLPAEPDEWLQDFISYEPPAKDPPADTRPRCEQHPDDDVIVETVRRCSSCRSEISRGVRIERHDESDNPVSIGNCSVQEGYEENTPSPVEDIYTGPTVQVGDNQCGLCRQPLRSAAERVAGCHSYDCLANEMPHAPPPLREPDVPLFAVTGDG